MQTNTNAYGILKDVTLARPAVKKEAGLQKLPMHIGYVGNRYISFPVKSEDSPKEEIYPDGYLTIPEDAERFSAGSSVSLELCRPLEELKKQLIIIGSHDPLMNVVSSLLANNQSDYTLRAAHVGSMGGLMAVRKGETHLAGIHLLNEKDGSYNEAFVRKQFREGGVRVVECVGRVQGIMVPKGNPKNITSIESLAGENIRYINRQKGSGTRILFDYLLKKQGISKDRIHGYDLEEFTHTEVASKISLGLADAGMGIHSAAKMYDLDFIPICNEQYDLLIPDNAWDTPMVQEFISIIKSEAFAEELCKMGGYTFDHPGEVRYHL